MSFKTIRPDELGKMLFMQSKIAKDAAQAALRTKSIEMRDTARNMAPIKFGNLREAINLRINRNQYDKSSYTIYTAESINGVNVSDYFNYIHNRRYAPDTPTWTNLGKKSQSYDGNPERVGERFMDRAFEKHEQSVYDEVEKALLNAMGL